MADITYIPMARGFLYLVAIMDWYSRYVLAWRLSNTLDADFCVDGLEEALRQGKPEIFNTDQGSQFTSEAFTSMLLEHGIRISMDGKGRYMDNIFVERLWRSVKYEEVYLKAYQNVPEARAGIGAYLRFYNHERPHQALGYQTPQEIFEEGQGWRCLHEQGLALPSNLETTSPVMVPTKPAEDSLNLALSLSKQWGPLQRVGHKEDSMNLVIRNVRLIDGTGADPLPRVSLEVTNGVISWIGEETTRPRRHVHREDINGAGLTLIPGMIDCHEHFIGDGGLDNMERLLGDTAEVYTLRAAGNARQALLSGVTSARDVGSRFGVSIRVAQDTASGAIPGPRIIAAGEWLQFPGTWPPGLTRLTETREDLIIAIREMIDRGAGLIKVGANGRRANGEWYGTLGPDVLDAAVRTAHEAGLKIAAHCVGAEASRQAVEAGIDSVEHGTHLEEETVRLMAEKGTYLVPTMSPWSMPEYLLDQSGMSPEERAFRLELKESSLASFQRALQAGVKIATGTDAGGSHARHGFIAREIELMVDEGMSPKMALESSTREAANLLGIQDQAGTIEVGKQADMVLIDGDPHSDPAALRNVWAVFLGGRRVL